MTADPARILGENLASLLDTDAKRQRFAELYETLVGELGPEDTRAWFINIDPELLDAPLMALSAGYTISVERAAHLHIGL